MTTLHQTMSAPRPHLEGLPLELLRVIADSAPPESAASLALVNKSMLVKLGALHTGLAPAIRAEFLKLMERNTPLVYCPWRKKLHLPERSLGVDDTTGRACQSQDWFWKFGTFFLPGIFHPTLLYGIAKYQREGRDASHLQALISSHQETKTATFDGITRESLPAELKLNGLGLIVTYRVRFWRVTILFKKWPRIRHCAHSNTKINFHRIERGDLAKGVTITCKERRGQPGLICENPVGQIHGCEYCHRVFRVDVQTDDPAFQPALVTVTVWTWLGKGVLRCFQMKAIKLPLSRSRLNCEASNRTSQVYLLPDHRPRWNVTPYRRNMVGTDNMRSVGSKATVYHTNMEKVETSEEHRDAPETLREDSESGAAGGYGARRACNFSTHPTRYGVNCRPTVGAVDFEFINWMLGRYPERRQGGNWSSDGQLQRGFSRVTFHYLYEQ
ncbi:hypothetical protein BJ170DRAFT_596020 [Xylariales sp. AK1849]|nr:hypothetical protein BJ170DRAFT_596020 [Xylariales sp. AK1849]